MRIIALAIGFAVLFSTIAVWGGSEPEEVKIIEPNDSQYIVRAPIRINSNADFDAAHGVTGGNGTTWNPWIIENYDINASGKGDCIYIGNTTQHFTIRNCYLHHASGPYTWYTYQTGIILNDAQNGDIINNTITLNQGLGIDVYLFYACSYANITGNIITANGDCGIGIAHNEYNNILNNIIASNHGTGISLSIAWHNNITNNTLLNNGCGIVLYDSCEQNIITHNTLINNFVQSWFGVAQAFDDGSNIWDDGYPLGGNYWSDYNGTDVKNGPSQNIPGSDGVGDTPYTNIAGGTGAHDNYPLMAPLLPPTTPAFKVQVVLGWNLISLPLDSIISDLPAGIIDRDGDTLWDRVMWYDSTGNTNHWKQYNKEWAFGLNDFKKVDVKNGMWINITVLGDGYLNISGTVPSSTSISLRAGWNLIGYPSLCTNMTIGNAFWGTGADIVEVFDPSAAYRTKVIGPGYLMKPGEGYWVHVPADSIWTVNW